MSTAAARLPGHRLHLQHGPIDLVIGAFGPGGEVERAYAAAEARFPRVLPELVEELPVLRAPIGDARPVVAGEIAQRMLTAVWPYRDRFITPMAAVAGAVAEVMLEVMGNAAALDRAYVNNGGDIAIHLASGHAMAIGVVGDLADPAIDGRVTITADDRVRGIATSGWRGRSLSLGIADAVTVLATTASRADAAATMIANAVTVDHPAIRRAPARSVRSESDLGDMPVTVDVGELPAALRRRALGAGQRRAEELIGAGLIEAAYLRLQGQSIVVDHGRDTARRLVDGQARGAM
ncbi:MAG TPA: UPF0280 family protein [Hyphomicrobiaceae bacterium]|nr:UPF0280 family protein [Hyphomicrobiaceae bacterium]